MTNLNSFNQFINHVTQTRNLSKHLFRIHDLAVHQLNPDEITKEKQTCFYFINETAKAVKKIENKVIKQSIPISEIDCSKLVNTIKSDDGQLSESLVVCHNLVCHCIHLMHFTPKVQTSLYYVSETAKQIKVIEQEINELKD
jgi:hypothetical protein